jgi:hypothetical protein
VKYWIDLALRHRLLDLAQLSCSVDDFFDRMAAANIPAVIVLSPLPCRDRVTMYYRLKVAELFRAASALRGFHYIDLTGIRGSHLFLDWHHLNEAGHRAVAVPVAESLVSIVDNLRVHTQH